MIRLRRRFGATRSLEDSADLNQISAVRCQRSP